MHLWTIFTLLISTTPVTTKCEWIISCTYHEQLRSRISAQRELRFISSLASCHSRSALDVYWPHSLLFCCQHLLFAAQITIAVDRKSFDVEVMTESGVGDEVVRHLGG